MNNLPEESAASAAVLAVATQYAAAAFAVAIGASTARLQCAMHSLLNFVLLLSCGWGFTLTAIHNTVHCASQNA